MVEGLEPVSAMAEKIEGSNANRQVQELKRNRELELVSPVSPAERSCKMKS